MKNKDFSNFSKIKDDQIFIIFIKLLRVIGLISKFFWWIPLCWSIGYFFRLEFSQGILPFLVCLLMLLIWRGTEKLNKVLDVESDGND